jgi:hypothetical protein
MRPDFVDNQELTLLNALQGHIQYRIEHNMNLNLDIATGYVNPQAFAMLADELEQCERVRLLFGADPLPPSQQPKRRVGETDETLQQRLVDEAMEALAAGLEHDRNLLGFTPEQHASVRRMLDLLQSGRVEVMQYPGRFLHGKTYVFGQGENRDCYLVGSSNFTAAGLTSNLELNVGRYDPSPVMRVGQWFDDLWQRSEPFDLAAVYEARMELNHPYLVFLRILWELYGDELTRDHDDGEIRLTQFQQDGLNRARRILNKYNGVIIADGVGLGKTFTAGALIEERKRNLRQRVLLIGPASLVNGPWERFCATHDVRFEKISYERLGGNFDADGNLTGNLEAHPDDYSLIVIDESQAFRNPNTQRAQALRWLLRGHNPKQIMLLTATPVNNSLWDLYYQLQYFIRNDAAFAEIGIRSMRERFHTAQDQDPFSLNPDYLFEILDATTVRRTRRFIRDYYPNDTVPIRNQITGEIERRQMVFPEPHVSRVDYRFTPRLEALLRRFVEIVIGGEDDDDEPELTMGRYRWQSYVLEEDDLDLEDATRQISMTGLLRSSLLKRLESSVYALAQTCGRMAESCEGFLDLLSNGFIANSDILGQWMADDIEEDDMERILETNPDNVTRTDGYNVEQLRTDVENDLILFRELQEMAGSIPREEDPKLLHLLDVLREIRHEADMDGFDDASRTNNRKVLLFSYYEDTIEWILPFLQEQIAHENGLEVYDGRIVSVSGSSGQGVSRENAVYGFAPISSDAPPGRTDDLYDLMVTTDVLAEGQNLQQCRHIVNYDLPWNPMRLVQRHGRIDRINSSHENVWMRCFFPPRNEDGEGLDDLLDLTDRIMAKVALASRSIGVENPPIPGAESGGMSFQQQRREIERLREEDATILVVGGMEGHAYSGEEFRRELEMGIERYGGVSRITDLAWGSGSVISNPESRGFVFCAVVGSGDDRKIQLRFVPEDPEGEMSDRRLDCIRRISITHQQEAAEPDPDLQAMIFDAWERARMDILRDWQESTDVMNLQPTPERIFRRVGEFLEDNRPPDRENEAINNAIRAVLGSWGERVARIFRAIYQPVNNGECNTAIEREDMARMLLDEIDRQGMEPYPEPEPLPVIDPNEIHLLSWMMIV